MMNVNLKGTLHPGQIYGKSMIDRWCGRIVFEARSCDRRRRLYRQRSL
jgi:hypothetical protein